MICSKFFNISIALRIMFTMPITTASAESNLSKLEIKKKKCVDYYGLRETSDLAIISI